MKQNRLVIIVLALGLVALVGAYLGSPFLAIRSLQAAAEAGDRDRLEALVDFPSVREGFKSQLNAEVVRRMRTDPDLADNPLAALGAALAPALVGSLVDAYVTPDAIAQMVRTGKSPNKAAEPAPAPAQPAAQPAEPAKTRPKVSYGYKGGLDRFDTAIAGDDGALTFTLTRTGLFGWRLTRIELPLGEG